MLTIKGAVGHSDTYVIYLSLSKIFKIIKMQRNICTRICYKQKFDKRAFVLEKYIAARRSERNVKKYIFTSK